MPILLRVFTVMMLASMMPNIPVYAKDAPHACARNKDVRTQVTFDVKIKPTRYDNRRTQKYLTSQGRKSLKEWRQKNEKNVWVSGSDDSNWHTQGVTRGAVTMHTSSKFIGSPYDKFGKYYCPYVKSVLVTIEYGSEIFVASDHKKGSCMYNEILAHEERHHDTNVDVVQTLAKRMEADMPRLIAMMEGEYVSKSRINQSFDKLKAGISDALDIYLEEISLRREEFNALVDSPEEYKRLSHVCK